jgi:hypothetical protein
VLAVENQLLVCSSGYDVTVQRLNEMDISFQVLTTLLDGIAPRHTDEDVVILALGLPGPNGEDIFAVTQAVRNALHPHRRKASPNHILIPATESHGCPHGHPSPLLPTDQHPIPVIQPAIKPYLQVTVIDSGYQWYDIWPPNPLGPRGITIPQPPEERIGGNGWIPYDPEQLSLDGGNTLVALAGHANFVAGLIAQDCPYAQITVRNHRGCFHPQADDFVTEAAVCRSLCLSGAADIINVGFAFAAFCEEISCAWDVAFNQLGQGTIGNGPFVVAPAGNQHSPVGRYPAALNTNPAALQDNPGGFPIIGVGSLDPPGNSPDVFSNYGDLSSGDWVACSVDANDVPSTFLWVDMAVEDWDGPLPPPPLDFRPSSWATWNGTSFAAPRIAARIADAMVVNKETPQEAFARVLGGLPPVALQPRGAPRTPNAGLGVLI